MTNAEYITEDSLKSLAEEFGWELDGGIKGGSVGCDWQGILCPDYISPDAGGYYPAVICVSMYGVLLPLREQFVVATAELEAYKRKYPERFRVKT
jgi:hypothetical protein